MKILIITLLFFSSVFSEDITNKNEIVFSSKMITGKNIYNRHCYACHGLYGEKTALDKSKVLKGWSEERLVLVLNGYKKGVYGSDLKDLMAAQTKDLDEQQIRLVAKYISTF